MRRAQLVLAQRAGVRLREQARGARGDLGVGAATLASSVFTSSAATSRPSRLSLGRW